MWLLCRNNLAGAFCALSTLVSAQSTPVNLVQNGNFEDRVGCPSFSGLDNVTGWSAEYGSPDYFHVCGMVNRAIPQNVIGFQYPESDSAYIGVGSYIAGTPGWQEIAVGLLSQPLESGIKYRVRFKFSYADSARYGVNKIGAVLSETLPSHPPFSQNISDVETELLATEIDTITWFQLDMVYTASGNENRIFIGTFSPENELTFVETNPLSSADVAYFYVDDIEVYEDDLVGVEEPESREVKVVVENGRLSLSDNELLIDVLDLSGRKVSEGVGGLDVVGLRGLYIIQVSQDGVPIHTEKRMFVQ